MESSSEVEKNIEREFMCQFIRCYRDLPSLWKLTSKEYYDRDQKRNDYDLLLEKYKERYPKATVTDLKKRLNMLRTNYRKELKKVKRTGVRPSLYYYSEMEFLEEAVRCKSSGTDAEYAEQHTLEWTQDYEEHENNSIEEEDPIEEKPTYLAIEKRAATTSIKQETKEEKRIKMDFVDISENKDKHYYWAMALAEDLRNMEQKQQIFAKKAIAEIVLEGQMGQLSQDSVKIVKSAEFGQIS